MNNLIKYLRIWALPALLAAALIVSLLKPPTDSLEQVSRRMQSKLNSFETLFTNAAQDKTLRDGLLLGSENLPELDNIEKKGLALYLFEKDSLVHWTSNFILPPPSMLNSPNGTSFMRLKNGWYQGMKWSDTGSAETLIGLVLVKNEYPFENKFLKNEFELGLRTPHNFEITEQKIKGSVPIRDLQGKALFYLYASAEEKADDVNWLLLAAQFILLLLLFYYVHRFTVLIYGRKGFLPGFLALVALLLLIRGGILWFEPRTEFFKLDLFNARYYASTVVTQSLGDLLLNVLMVVWIVVYAVYYYPAWREKALRNKPVALVLIASVIAGIGLISWVFKTLVMDSVISFEVYNILSLNTYSVLGLLCIAMLCIAHFLLSRITMITLIDSGYRPAYLAIVFGFCAVIYLLFAIGSAFFQVILFSGFWAFVHSIAMLLLLEKSRALEVKRIILYLSMYCILSVFLIENLYERKERNQRRFFASRLVTERDFIAEYTFDDIADRISNDPYIKSFFLNPAITKKDVTSRLSSLYLSGYFNKYDLRLIAFDKHGNSFKNRDTLATVTHFYRQLKRDSVDFEKLYYFSDTAQNYSYLAFIPVKEDSTFEGQLVIHLVPKFYYGQNVYPELLLGESVSASPENSIYDYAIYRHDKLISQHGDFPYAYYWSKAFQFGDQQYVFIDEGEWEHVIYRFANDMKVVVTIGQEGLFEPVATFSYIFAFYFVLILFAFLAVRIMRGDFLKSNPLTDITLSFRTRINYSMLLMIVFSFVIIGLITMSFFRQQYNNFYNDRLLRKEKVLHASLEFYLQQNAPKTPVISNDYLSSTFNLEVVRLAEINDIDINLYDGDGTLAVASQPAVYDKGLVSRKMNPDAYFELINSKSSQVTEQENIGVLNYLATYAPLRDSHGDAVAYMGIPYFERSKNVSDEVSSFLVALMNVYVFLLICAAVLAYFISNSITRPLTIISEKLRILNLNKKNEPIQWKSKDEIGVLIGEYNKMIKELEQSAHKLARSERESAWREMAKQIAHEIKNPLTPMKLSIQYLRRAIDANEPNVAELSKKVTKTLEEQIENLSSIATAFSSFAKMPKVNNEIVNLNELVKSIADLFAREGEAEIAFSSESKLPMVFADKNQLISLLNNLLKNAIQSIPEGRPGFVDIHIKDENGLVIASVSDNGTGIAKENYDKVFVPNFTTKSSGAGLGLAISKQIIEGSGGELYFESKENVGTTFYVKLKNAANL